jgi:hypothetical protein
MWRRIFTFIWVCWNHPPFVLFVKHKCIWAICSCLALKVTHLISNLVFSTWIWCITFEAILYEENELNSFTRLYCKVFSSTIFNHKHLEYIKSRLTLFLSKFFVSYKRNKHSTPWTSWKTNFGIIKTQTWICAPSCLINIFFSLQNFPYESHCLMARQGFLLCKCIVDKKLLEIGGILDYNLDGKSNKIVLTFVCLNEHLNFCSQICSFHIVGSNFFKKKFLVSFFSFSRGCITFELLWNFGFCWVIIGEQLILARWWLLTHHVHIEKKATMALG